MNETELRDFFFNCLEGRDASSFEECVHEDFIYIFAKLRCLRETSFVLRSSKSSYKAS